MRVWRRDGYNPDKRVGFKLVLYIGADCPIVVEFEDGWLIAPLVHRIRQSQGLQYGRAIRNIGENSTTPPTRRGLIFFGGNVFLGFLHKLTPSRFQGTVNAIQKFVVLRYHVIVSVRGCQHVMMGHGYGDGDITPGKSFDVMHWFGTCHQVLFVFQGVDDETVGAYSDVYIDRNIGIDQLESSSQGGQVPTESIAQMVHGEPVLDERFR
mmetsp:Transcript_1242/g.2711  ORF Transcript_1242/g.2711 Transcript_1242/m.2711 type:complete len:209 (-) Transcript_1242:525-1151(-)